MVERLSHRVRTHEAALRLAESVGNPPRLMPYIEETRLRLDEARACLETIKEVIG